MPVAGDTMWAMSFVQQIALAKSTMMFTAHAHAAGDALVLQLGCHAVASTNEATAVTVAASAAAVDWTWTTLDDVTIGGTLAAASFAAIAPDTSSVTITVTWTGTASDPCTEKVTAIGDDFTTEGAHVLAFDRHSVSVTTDACSGHVVTGGDGAAVWAACNAKGEVVSVDPPYTKAADDGRDWTAYRLTADPAGTDEMVTLPTSNSAHAITEVATIVEE
jgi:hypothetical protein